MNLAQFSRQLEFTIPKCLKEFQLETLINCKSQPSDSFSIVRAELMRQHTGLEYLSLHFPGAIELFLNENFHISLSRIPRTRIQLRHACQEMGACVSEISQEARRYCLNDER